MTLQIPHAAPRAALDELAPDTPLPNAGDDEAALVRALLRATGARRIVEVDGGDPLWIRQLAEPSTTADPLAWDVLVTQRSAAAVRRELDPQIAAGIVRVHAHSALGPEAAALADALRPIDALLLQADGARPEAILRRWAPALRDRGLVILRSSGDANGAPDLALPAGLRYVTLPTRGEHGLLILQRFERDCAAPSPAIPATAAVADDPPATIRGTSWALADAEALRARPWEALRLPALRYPPTMLQRDELRQLYWLARDVVGDGAILDLGAWQGGSTAALAQGVRDRTADRATATVHAFDQFMWDAYSAHCAPEVALRPGDDMLPLFERNTAAWAPLIRAHRTDLFDARWNPADAIALLFIDAAKTPALMEVVWNTFGPALRPGSVVVFQDFKHYATSHLPVLTQSLPGLAPAWVCRDGGAVAFRVQGSFAPLVLPPQTRDVVNQAYAAACAALAWDPPTVAALHHAWAHELLRIGDAKAARARFLAVRGQVVCAGAADAPAALAELLELDADTTAPSSPLSETLRATYARALDAESEAEHYRLMFALEQQNAAQHYERAILAEQANADARQAAEAAGAERDATAQHFALAEAKAASNQAAAAHAAEQLRAAASAAERARAEAAALRAKHAALAAQTAKLERERDRLRWLWPPAILRHGLDRLRRAVRRDLTQAWRRDFGRKARVAVLLTGLPEPDAAEALLTLLAQQSRAPDLLVMPGALREHAASDRVHRVVVHNWWSPDLPWLLREIDVALLLHPQHYGPGPLWDRTLSELLVAALASDANLAAILLRSADDARIGTPNHLFETDAATIAQWPEASLALACRADVLPSVFDAVHPHESRDLRPIAQHLLERGRKLLVAPQTFPRRAAVAAQGAASLGEKLPATPRAATRALFVTQYLNCGGADKGAIDLLQGVDPALIDFSLLTTIASDHPWAARVRPHVRELVHLGATLPLPPAPRFSDFLVAYVKRRQIGLVHIMHSFLGYDALPRLRREIPRVKVVDQCHILEPPDILEGGHPAYSSRRYKRLIDHRTVTSQWLKRYLIRAHRIAAHDISVIYTGVDAEHAFNPQRIARGGFRAEMGLPADAFIVLFAGRLHRQKRPWLSLDVAAELFAKRPTAPAWFVFVGDGEEGPTLRERAARMACAGRIVFAGQRDEMAEVYADSDVLLMPSSHEGLAYVSFEAMAMGLPQIFSDVNAQHELITPDTGVLIPAEDEARLVRAATKALLELLDNPSRRASMSAAARARVLQHFTLTQMVRQYEDVYRRLLGR